MKDYSAMSDFEINKQVAIIQGHKCYYDNGSYTNGYNKISVIVKGNGIIGQFDPCNNPADAWPILMANHIGIMPFKSGAATAWPTSIGLLSNFHVKHENPLRAAMICYLMMKDAEKCDG